MMNKLVIYIIVVLVSVAKLSAQELQANVEIMHSKIQGVDPKVFNTLKSTLTEFINNRKWTNDNFKPFEKIQCSFFINISEIIGSQSDNTYKATLTIQSSRPIYNSTFNATLFNYLDRDVIFKYEPSTVINFDDNRVSTGEPLVSNLSAIIAYYVYMILGFDYDSFSENGGNNYFKKAQNIVVNAPEDTRLINGWKSTESAKRNRYWLVEQVLSPSFSELRTFSYHYHLKGLDNIRLNADVAYNNIANQLFKLKDIASQNPNSIYIISTMNAKNAEFVDVLGQLPVEKKNELKKILAEIDIPNAAKYKNVK